MYQNKEKQSENRKKEKDESCQTMNHRDSVERESDNAIKMPARIYDRHGVGIHMHAKHRVPRIETRLLFLGSLFVGKL